MKIFQLSKEYSVVCNSEKTRYGFRHLATLCRNGGEVCKDKRCYYNRTWESYDFQSVVHGVIGKFFSEADAKKYEKAADAIGRGESSGLLKSASLVAAMGEVLCDNQKDKNAWKKRMFKAAGLDFPEDWDSLSEDEQKKRLDAVQKEGLKNG